MEYRIESSPPSISLSFSFLIQGFSEEPQRLGALKTTPQKYSGDNKLRLKSESH